MKRRTATTVGKRNNEKTLQEKMSNMNGLELSAGNGLYFGMFNGEVE